MIKEIGEIRDFLKEHFTYPSIGGRDEVDNQKMQNFGGACHQVIHAYNAKNETLLGKISNRLWNNGTLGETYQEYRKIVGSTALIACDLTDQYLEQCCDEIQATFAEREVGGKRPDLVVVDKDAIHIIDYKCGMTKYEDINDFSKQFRDYFKLYEDKYPHIKNCFFALIQPLCEEDPILKMGYAVREIKEKGLVQMNPAKIDTGLTYS